MSGRRHGPRGRGRIRRSLSRLREAYWPIPAGCAALAGLGAIALVQLDEGLRREGFELAFTGGPESSRSLLSTIAASTLTLAALVFSITMVVLQLASSQFSPRALNGFLRDRQSQLTLGVFLATFVFALVTLREIRGEDGLVDRFIPGVTISVAFALALLSVGLFVVYIHHIAQSIRVVNIIERIADETQATIERVETATGPGDDTMPDLPPRARVLRAPTHGVVTFVDASQLVELATEADVSVEVVPRVGQFVVEGAPLVRIHGSDGDVIDDRWLGAVELSRERDARQDVAYGLRQLVDIAERALSPGVNDPSTAVACLDQLHDLLTRLVVLTDPSVVHRDDDGTVRAIIPVQRWDHYVALAVDEIRHWGRDSLQVRSRLQAMVDDLLEVADSSHRPPLLDRQPLWARPLGVPVDSPIDHGTTRQPGD